MLILDAIVLSASVIRTLAWELVRIQSRFFFIPIHIINGGSICPPPISGIVKVLETNPEILLKVTILRLSLIDCSVDLALLIAREDGGKLSASHLAV